MKTKQVDHFLRNPTNAFMADLLFPWQATPTCVARTEPTSSWASRRALGRSISQVQTRQELRRGYSTVLQARTSKCKVSVCSVKPEGISPHVYRLQKSWVSGRLGDKSILRLTRAQLHLCNATSCLAYWVSKRILYSTTRIKVFVGASWPGSFCHNRPGTHT
jgi:hypothetical protein